MSNTFVTRPLDQNGRIVIPRDIRAELELHDNDLMEISSQNGVIYLTKHKKGCVICGTVENTVYVSDRPVCLECIKNIKNSFAD